MELGRIGIWSSYRPFGIERAGEAAKLAEQLGYAAWWVGGSPHVPDVRPVLEATSALVVAVSSGLLGSGTGLVQTIQQYIGSNKRGICQAIRFKAEGFAEFLHRPLMVTEFLVDVA